jgi:UDP-N-acetylglucosamine 4,6-dehydratase/5-epimerase
MSNTSCDQEFFRDKVVVVTGGTGTIGERIVQKLLALPTSEVRVFSRDEQKHVALDRKIGVNNKLKFVVGDVRDESRAHQALDGANLLFHVAAIKHVHLAEYNPVETVKTNVIGASIVSSIAKDVGIEKCVAVSTDKAVEPIGVMGMTKAIQERIFTLPNNGGPISGCVRFGNVLASSGSVVPLFKKMLDGGKKTLTVTHAKMTRFMMTVDQAADLTLFAMSTISHGDIVVLEQPSFLLTDLAEVMLEAYGIGPEGVEVVGLRPGERIHETLVSRDETARMTKTNGYILVHSNYNANQIVDEFATPITSDNVPRMTKDQIKELLVECKAI